MTPPEIGTMAISTSFKAGTPAWELEDECLREWLIGKRFKQGFMIWNEKKIHVTKKSHSAERNSMKLWIYRIWALTL